MARGPRESQWLVLRRCLAIIRRVQQGPTDWRGLVEAVLTAEPEAYGPRQEEAGPDLLYDDLARIRQNLGIEIKADPRTKEYAIVDTALPLLDLPDQDLATIAWLEQTFHPHSPQHEAVWSLLERLRFYLASDRRRVIEQQRTALIVELGPLDEDQILPEVEAALMEALVRRRRVELEYISAEDESGQPRRHVADFYEPPRFEASLGHYYLLGWCHYRVGPEGRSEVNAYRAYRLGRIRQVKLLPNHLQPSPPLAKTYQVMYVLTPTVARQGVTRRRWIDIKSIDRHADGSATVSGTTDTLFFAMQELLHYRYHCQVLGGPELLAEMQETVKKMAASYNSEE